MSAGSVLAIVFASLAGAEAVGLTLALVAWRRARRRYADLERSLQPVPRIGRVETAGRVVRTVVQQAARVREHGVTQLLSSSLEDLVRWARADRDRIVQVADRDGRVTLFFSDIAESTALNERVGDRAWVRILTEHDRLVRREIERRDGIVVKTIGDGFMAVFGQAVPAVQAAVAVHTAMAGSRRLRATPLSLRIGLHTGTAINSGDDWFGRNVALCARIAAHAAGGATLVSGDTRAAAADMSDDADVLFVAEGEADFKGITGAVEIWSVARVADLVKDADEVADINADLDAD